MGSREERSGDCRWWRIGCSRGTVSGTTAKRGHRRSSHYDNGDRRGVSAHP